MAKRKSTKQFIIEARQIHKKQYDYSHVKYINTNHKVEIWCSKHGAFNQDPKSHLRGVGCPHCSRENQTAQQYLTTESFIERARNKHKNKYDYSQVQYINHKTKISIICKEHGTFRMMPSTHIFGQGCPKCGDLSAGSKKRISHETFLSRIVSKYGDKFDYSQLSFTRLCDPVTILCRTHGAFDIRASYLLDNKLSCTKCVYENKQICINRVGGYTLELFESSPELKTQPGKFYVLIAEGNNERFVKIGITIQSINKRYPKMWGGVYKFQEKLIQHMPLFDAFQKEQHFLQTYATYQYKPLQRFDGWTECFSIDILDLLLG